MPASRHLVSTVLFLAISSVVVPSGQTSPPKVPRFEPAPCDYPPSATTAPGTKRECGWLVVPESRARPTERTFRLAVLVNHPEQPITARPLLLLHGGPGGDGGTRFTWSEMLLPAVRQRHVVIFDMRGAGASEPQQLCPDFQAKATPALNLRTPQEREAAFREVARACAASLKAQGLDFHAFGADVSAADAIDLRHVLGYDSWDIYGVSYGGFVAQELMRRDAKAVHSAGLISTSSFAIDFAAEEALGAQHKLERVFALCRQQAACARAFPTIEQDFYELYNEFATKPLEVVVPGAAPARSVWLDGERFLREIGREFGGPVSVRRLPLLIHDLRHGDRDGALKRLIGDGVMRPWDPLGRLVQCNEYGERLPTAIAEVKSKVRPEFRVLVDDIRERCDGWFARFERQADRRPVVSDAPTLIVQGEFDLIDADRSFKVMTAGLTHAYTHVFPGETHANPTFGCHGRVVDQFVADPSRAPDTSCTSRMPGTPFRTTGYAPTLTIVIRSQTDTVTPFTGTWEASMGGGPDWTLQLETDAQAVRGTLVEQLIPIEHGRIENEALRFSMKSPDGARTVTFTGQVVGDEIRFTRDVAVIEGGSLGGPGLLGGLGPKTLVAKRRN